MKTIYVFHTGVGSNSATEFRFNERGLVRRVLFSSAIQIGTRGTTQASLRRGASNTVAPASGDQNVVAGVILCGTGGTTALQDVPVHELVAEGDKWHLVLNLLSGSPEGFYAAAIIHFEPVA